MGETDKDIKADIVVEFAKLNSTGLARIDHTRDYERYGIIKLNSDLSKWISTDGNTIKGIKPNSTWHAWTRELKCYIVVSRYMYIVDCIIALSATKLINFNNQMGNLGPIYLSQDWKENITSTM